MRPLALTTPPTRRTRAIDVGAGVGRVTSDVLLHLVDDVVLVEPVTPFIEEALRRGRASADGSLVEDSVRARWKGVQAKTKSVTFVQGTLQALDPVDPLAGETTLLARVGYVPPGGEREDLKDRYDVVWCQWCLGHLSDADLVPFFRRCKAALRDAQESLIIVKENLCTDGKNGAPRAVFDESDSSLTRYYLSLYLEHVAKHSGVQVGQSMEESLCSRRAYAHS